MKGYVLRTNIRIKAMFTFKDEKFYLDGEEFRIRSGALHYFRTFPEYWESLMNKYLAAGLNCVETYCCWNLHESEKGKFDFSGRIDLEKFIETAEKVGLKVILRPGPFICAEWDNGGLPSWLFKDETLRLRCNKEPFISHLRDYYKVLLSKIKPHLDSNGGPVIAIALENEYGSFGDDFDYLTEVENIYHEAGLDCLFFSADGNRETYLCSGSHDPIVKGIDFGATDSDMKDVFADSRKYMDGKAPYFAAEYWGGNFTHWGDKACFECDNVQFEKNIRQMVEMGISFNDYMFFGGTNFGFMGGANMVAENGKIVYIPDVTSYDYDAAITEWGDYTEKYYITRRLLEKERGHKLPPIPPAPEYQNIGRVELTHSASLFDNMQIAKTVMSKTVEPMEHYGQAFGYIRYRKTMERDAPYPYIQLEGLRDRAHVYLNGELLGIRMRDRDESWINLPLPRGLKKGDIIDVFVENMGRVNHGPLTYRGDRKGIIGAVIFNERILFDWEVSCFEMNDISGIEYREGTLEKCPAFIKGEFEAEYGKECFVHMDNFTKGIVFINGFNIGRYWDIGPQSALYIPGILLREKNTIEIFETDGVKGDARVNITDKPGLLGKTHWFGEMRK
jgi:beta-galactosidase